MPQHQSLPTVDNCCGSQTTGATHVLVARSRLQQAVQEAATMLDHLSTTRNAGPAAKQTADQIIIELDGLEFCGSQGDAMDQNTTGS